MKILILSQTFPLDPADPTAHFMYDFAYGFAEIGHKVTVLLPYHPNLKPKSFKSIKVVTFKYIWPGTWHALGFGRTLENDQNLKWFALILSPLYVIFGVIKLIKIVNKDNIEVVNAHWILPNGFIAAIVALLLKKRLVITIPGSDVYIAKKNILYNLAAKFAVKNSSKIVSNSPQLLKDMDIKGEIISYGVPENKGKRILNKKLVIATAGRPVEKKGFEIIKKTVPEIEIISGLSIDNFRKKLLSVDIFIAYSIRDSKGNLDDASLTIIEAMAAGCAVIATDLPGNRTLIKNDVYGLLVSSSRINELKYAVDKLRKSKRLREQLGNKARKDAAAILTPKSIAKKYLQVFSATTI